MAIASVSLIGFAPRALWARLMARLGPGDDVLGQTLSSLALVLLALLCAGGLAAVLGGIGWALWSWGPELRVLYVEALRGVAVWL